MKNYLVYIFFIITSAISSQELSIKRYIVKNQEKFFANDDSFKQIIGFNPELKTLGKITDEYFSTDQIKHLLLYMSIVDGKITSTSIIDFRAIKEIRIRKVKELYFLSTKFNDEYFHQYIVVRNNRFKLKKDSHAIWLLNSDGQSRKNFIHALLDLGKEFGTKIKLTY